MSVWRDEIPTDGAVELPPDPRVLDGLGRNHSLETALADLVDNSIDAGATDVLIRLVRHCGQLRALCVADNGRGMSPEAIDAAMTVGGQRKYQPEDLGHFGLGLKAASFSQAHTLTVMSKAANRSAVGRQWKVSRDQLSFLADVVPTEISEEELTRPWHIPWAGVGTVVRWDDLIGFPITDDALRVEQFVTHTAESISHHLGLVFHRILEGGRVRIAFDTEDVENGAVGLRFPVVPLDPMGYQRSGRAGYPKDLVSKGEPKIRFRCHIWPGRSNLPEFKLPGGPERRQGLYIYRRGRLLHAGGEWGGLTAPGKRLQLARVEVDIDDDLSRLFRMNAEKSRVMMGAEFTHTAESAVAEDGTTFATYLENAEEAFRESRRRRRQRRRMLPPGSGFTPLLRKAIADEVPFLDDNHSISIRWKRFESYNDDFFELDREGRTLWLNDRYRPALLGERRGGLNDVPVLKALLYLLMEDAFQGNWLGPKDKDNLELWQEILTAAAKSAK